MVKKRLSAPGDGDVVVRRGPVHANGLKHRSEDVPQSQVVRARAEV
jgi:hypothetical protein